VSGWVLHTGALRAFARGSTYMAAVLRVAVDHDRPLLVPTSALAEAWADTSRDNRYRLDYLMGLDVVAAEELDPTTARAVGDLLATTGTHDVTVGHCVHLAVAAGWTILTDDAAPLWALQADVIIEEVP
jgi:hypothetical protein